MNALAMLGKFASDGWTESCKESDFTNHLTKVLAVSVEATASANGPVIAASQRWVQGLGAGKTFMKQYREWTKSKYKNEKVTNLSPHIDTFIKFLAAADAAVASSLEMLAVKVDFFGAIYSTPQQLSKCWQILTDSSLHELLERFLEHRDAEASCAPWLRSLLHPALCNYVATWKDDNVDITTWLGQCESILAGLAERKDDAEGLCDIIGDIQALTMVLNAACSLPGPPRGASPTRCKCLIAPSSHHSRTPCAHRRAGLPF